MGWQGEENFTRYFGLRGLKCLCAILREENNILRAAVGLPARTWAQFLARMDALMEEHAADDDGAEPW